MLSRQGNELLCGVGRGTPMGDLLRHYWLQFLPSTELSEPDCPPKKVRLLGEDLVTFRDTQGQVGLVAAHCPHRGASLFFGRNEECGLRCVYHGWKFDVTGRCVDMPNEPEGSTFKDKVRARAYPCRDVNGVLWTYMGPRETAPALPAFEINTLPPEHVYPPLRMLEECNWGQALEGDIDASHIDYLLDRQLAKNDLMIGIPFLVNLQDRAMTETMGPIYDRTNEHLGTTDAMVIYVRRRLIDAARALREQGVVPANVDDAAMCRVRPASALLPEGDSWITATEKARQSDAGVPIAWVPFAQ